MHSGENKCCSNSTKWGEKLEPIPTDLIIEIFSRLPARSVARFRTLSKLWASMLGSPEFSELFRSRSSLRPRLLFAVERYAYNTWLFFSTPQPHNRYENSSHVDFHSKFAGDVSQYICSYASGLLYFHNVRISAEEKPLICNPITGMYVSLPDLRKKYRKPRGFLGFDPTENQFKVLSEIYQFSDQGDQHELLTLGTGELRWRSNITSSTYDRSLNDGICIDGVLYFLAEESDAFSCVIVRFDLRSEEFKLIDAECFNDQLALGHPLATALNNPLAIDVVPVHDTTKVVLINYKGHLGGINWKYGQAGGRRTIELCMWLLEDVENQEWLKYVYTLPENKVLDSCEFSGVTARGEFVLCMKYTCNPFFVFYFKPEKNTLQSVEIQGFGANLEAVETRGEVFAFVDHVEDLSVNDAKQLKSSISHISYLCSCCNKEVKAA